MMSDKPQDSRLVRSDSYFRQLHAASVEMGHFLNSLRDNGWIFHEETGHWTHPDKPGTEIWPG